MADSVHGLNLFSIGDCIFDKPNGRGRNTSMRGWPKRVLVASGILLAALWLIADIVGLVSLDENLNEFGRIMNGIGFVNIVALTLMILGVLLFADEVWTRASSKLTARRLLAFRIRDVKSRLRGIKWNPYANFMEISSGPDGTGIGRLKVMGTCTARKGLHINEAYVQSFLTGERLDGKVNDEVLERSHYLRCGEEFKISFEISPKGAPEISLAEFFQRFGRLRLYIRSGTREQVEVYEPEEIYYFIAKANLHNVAPSLMQAMLVDPDRYKEMPKRRLAG